MRNTLALVALGATVGVCMKVFPVLGFGSTEGTILSWVIGAFVWHAIRTGGKTKADAGASLAAPVTTKGGAGRVGGYPEENTRQ